MQASTNTGTGNVAGSSRYDVGTGNVGHRSENFSTGFGPDESRESRMGPIQGVTQGASNVLGDLLDLAELQAQLLKLDAGKCTEQAKSKVVGLLVAMAVLLASLPVLAFGLSELVHWLSDWPLWGCHLLVGLAFSVVGVGVGWWSVKGLRSSMSSFGASQREAHLNLRWLRNTLVKTF